MLNYIEFLEIPGIIAIIIVALFLVTQIIGEILEFKGKVVPEILKIRKYFLRKKQQRELLSNLVKTPSIMQSFEEMPKIVKEVKDLLNDVNQHYSSDNITKRNDWMNWVNNQANTYDKSLADLKKKLDENNVITLSLLIDSKRNAIIEFASKVIDESYPATREQFNRIFKLHTDYEKIIEENGMTNGEVDIAYRIITESYENHMRNHTFIENIRGYDSNE